MPASAYLLTLTTYGSHLPGDDRASFRRGGGTIPPNGPLRGHAEALLRTAPVEFCDVARPIVLHAIRGVAAHRGWRLFAAHVRTEHVHCVIAGPATAEKMTVDLKAYATRALRAARYVSDDARVWSRHGSMRPLSTEDEIAAAAYYVRERQGEPMSRYP